MSEAEEPRGQRKKATVRKEEIIGIAAEMFALRGYNGTSLRDMLRFYFAYLIFNAFGEVPLAPQTGGTDTN